MFEEGYGWIDGLRFLNNDSNDYKFTGKKRDAETGLDYFGARYYSNGLGRWVSADWSSTPIPVPYADFSNPQSLNLYGFVGGNPASKADPDGHCPICIPIVIEIVEDITLGELASAAGTGAALGTTAGLATKYPSLSQPVMEPGAYALGRYLAHDESLTPIPGQLQSKTTDAPANPNKPGTLGKPDHQATVEEERQRVGGKKEVTIPTPDGSKDNRRADAVGTNPETGAPEVVQVYRPTKAGNVPKREVDAANDIEKATGIKPKMVPVRPLPKKKDP